MPDELSAAAGELRRRGESSVPSAAGEIVARVYDVYLGPVAQDLLRLAALLEDGEPLTSDLAALLLADRDHGDPAGTGPAESARGSGDAGGATGRVATPALAELGTPWELVDASGLLVHPAVREVGRARLTRDEHARASAVLRRWRAARRAVRPRARLTPDRWTTDDQLGHRTYAEAVAAFVRHPETLPPLTIGVKGPWGTGKTSLMRMIQDLLDPGTADGSPAEIHLARPGSSPRQAGRRRRAVLRRKARGSSRVTIAEVLSCARRRGGDRSREDPRLSAPERPALRASDWRPTVWFNPWMYQNGEQVWAGLAHEIITQVTGRLPRGERERFWLKLNLARIDREAVRRRAYRMAITRLTPVALGLAATIVLTCASLAAAALVPAFGPALRAAAAALGTCGSVAALAGGAVRLARFLTESADTAFGRLIRPPDLLGPAPGLAGDLVGDPGYGAKTGFLHLVQTDMRRVLRLVATEERPLVVFVDDLDRCGSGTVAQVIEAINLFLAGEFPNCVFVLAMEPDVVAAHVEVAYQDLAEAMPADLRSGLGWRFLEKIVQLPLSLPALEDAHRLPGYVGALLGVDRRRERPRPPSDGTDRGPEAEDGDAPGAGAAKEPGDDGVRGSRHRRHAARGRDQARAAWGPANMRPPRGSGCALGGGCASGSGRAIRRSRGPAPRVRCPRRFRDDREGLRRRALPRKASPGPAACRDPRSDDPGRRADRRHAGRGGARGARGRGRSAGHGRSPGGAGRGRSSGGARRGGRRRAAGRRTGKSVGRRRRTGPVAGDAARRRSGVRRSLHGRERLPGDRGGASRPLLRQSAPAQALCERLQVLLVRDVPAEPGRRGPRRRRRGGEGRGPGRPLAASAVRAGEGVRLRRDGPGRAGEGGVRGERRRVGGGPRPARAGALRSAV
ncbi:KAP family P-loop NTPase fold protein [Microtetraspora malaysiensis]|uniref:KAP family P-loop NTPase fold protein n=1 Tax=Microtetraspora malaysiensis TaxID=161358 RepID=UPI003D89DEAB